MQQEILQQKRTKIIIAVSFALLLLIVVISIVTIISRSGKIKTTIHFEPASAQVFLNETNKNINNKTIYLDEGDYKISAFLDGYIYQEKEYNINTYNSEINGRLIPIDASAEDVVGYLEELNKTEQISQMETNKKLEQTFPILDYLPYSTLNDSFSITYNFNKDYTQLTIIINPKERDDPIALNTACDTLKNFNKDISISQYDITINNFTNVLEGKFQENNKTDPLDFIRTGFSDVKNIYVQDGKNKDDYYYTVIEKTIKLDNTDKTDYIPYRVVLKKQDNVWKLVGTPTLLLTTYNTPNTPTEILDLANFYNNRREYEETR